VRVQQRWPWNGLVDIDYEIVSDKPAETDFYVWFTAKDGDLNRTVAPRTLTGDSAGGAGVKAGVRRTTWDMAADEPGFHSSALTMTVQAYTAKPYLVIDLSPGASAAIYPVRFSAAPPDLSSDVCRTTNLWLRFVQPGIFTMGSPSDELGREASGYYYAETQHTVTLTQPYYIGVFEITQKQWQLVMGNTPAYYKGDTRPVETVSYDDIRGTLNGAAWPANGQTDADSFIGRLRARAELLIDLPTEAQWEYACRAGTSTALNSGKNLTAMDVCPNLAKVGRYYGNTSDGKGGYSQHTKAGSYLPNAWGLYDMHGNVFEWCLDWNAVDLGAGGVTDPSGPASGSYRVLRGGGFSEYPEYCRSADRNLVSNPSDRYSVIGLRVLALPVVQ
jgi:formylglycine-generating enzyme required for sulfatase activity